MFPTNIQNVVWTQAVTEGSPIDESITFSSAEGVVIGSDIGLAFRIKPERAPNIYLKFRQPDLQIMCNTYIRNAVREAFNSVASKVPVQEIYGVGKSKLVADVVKALNDKLGEDGFIIDQLTINGALRLPENVAAAINKSMEATQKAVEAENKVRQIKAEAEQAIAAAQGSAEAVRAKASGDADAMLIRAKAEAKSNMIIRLSTNSTVLHYNAINKWNGVMPMMNNGQMPMLTFDVGAIDPDAAKKLQELLTEPTVSTAAVSTAAVPPVAAPPAVVPLPGK
jgi:regulator of protease activity HflC (stomatin/prohibitin superfamily)